MAGAGRQPRKVVAVQKVNTATTATKPAPRARLNRPRSLALGIRCRTRAGGDRHLVSAAKQDVQICQ